MVAPYVPVLPVLNAARCTGCGDCVAVCPTACLAARDGRPWLPRPADCVSCGACATICPADAVSFPAPEPTQVPTACTSPAPV